MEKIGLDRWEVTTAFRTVFGDRVTEDPLIHSIAEAVGEVIEQNNKGLWGELMNALEKRG